MIYVTVSETSEGKRDDYVQTITTKRAGMYKRKTQKRRTRVGMRKRTKEERRSRDERKEGKGKRGRGKEGTVLDKKTTTEEHRMKSPFFALQLNGD